MAFNPLETQAEGGQIPLVPATGGEREIILALNNVIRRINNNLNTQILFDGKTRRLLIGYQKGGFENGAFDFGIKMSVEGEDVVLANDDKLVFSMSLRHWTWRNDQGQVVKQFDNNSGTDSYYQGDRNYANLGLRPDTETYGFEIAKPNETLGNEPQ